MAKRQKKRTAENPIAEGAKLLIEPDRGSRAVRAGKRLVSKGMKEAGKGLREGFGILGRR